MSAYSSNRFHFVETCPVLDTGNGIQNSPLDTSFWIVTILSYKLPTVVPIPQGSGFALGALNLSVLLPEEIASLL